MTDETVAVEADVEDAETTDESEAGEDAAEEATDAGE